MTHHCDTAGASKAETTTKQPALPGIRRGRGGHLGVAEHGGPFSEGEIGGDDDGGALVEPADDMEQKAGHRIRRRVDIRVRPGR